MSQAGSSRTIKVADRVDRPYIRAYNYITVAMCLISKSHGGTSYSLVLEWFRSVRTDDFAVGGAVISLAYA